MDVSISGMPALFREIARAFEQNVHGGRSPLGNFYTKPSGLVLSPALNEYLIKAAGCIQNKLARTVKKGYARADLENGVLGMEESPLN